MRQVRIEKTLYECLFEAFKNNAIITSDGLASNEFIHTCNGKAYYEDGGCLGSLSEANELLSSQGWANEHKWYIIGYLEEKEIQAIKDMRNKPKVYDSFSYEEEINKIISEVNKTKESE